MAELQENKASPELVERAEHRIHTDLQKIPPAYSTELLVPLEIQLQEGTYAFLEHIARTNRSTVQQVINNILNHEVYMVISQPRFG